MNPEFVDQNVGSDVPPELEYAAPVFGNGAELNDFDRDFEEEDEDCPPILEDFHENVTLPLDFSVMAEEGMNRNFETPENSRLIYADYICHAKSDQCTEKSKTSCHRSKESSTTGNSLKKNIENSNERCSVVELRGTFTERNKRGLSNRFQMMDADDCIDNNDSEKDDDKMDEDDDDLTKKLLSIQVLPRIPKIKRTETSISTTSSDSSVPHRSVLERAEVLTKSSSYPKWPKSSPTDNKQRWHNDRKSKDTSKVARNRKEVELRTNMSRNFSQNGLSGTNFRRPVDIEKPKSNFSKRVPCELLFDAVVAKENSRTTLSCKKDNLDSGTSDSNSCSIFSLADVENGSADAKIYTDCKDDKSRSSKDQEMSKLQNDVQLRNSFQGENFENKEIKTSTALSQSKISELKSRESRYSNQSKSCHFSDKQLFPIAPQKLYLSGTGDSRNQNGSLSDVKSQNISSEHTNFCSTDNAHIFSHEPLPMSTIFKSEDVLFKRPSSGRVPRSKVLERSTGQTSVNSASSKIPLNFEAVPLNWSDDGSEQFKSKRTTTQNDSQRSPDQMGSDMDVVDMDVVASPLCDDKLLLSAEPVVAAESSTNVAARKVVTFDCPEDADSARRNGSKMQKTSKREKGAQLTSFETKCDIQKQVVSEMKELLRPLYSKRKISKEEYKEIMRLAVPKLCHNRKTPVASLRIRKYADKYTCRVLKSRKKSSAVSEEQKPKQSQ